MNYHVRKQLVDALNAKDFTAFTNVTYGEYSRLVFLVALGRRSGLGLISPEDLVQEVFARFMKRYKIEHFSEDTLDTLPHLLTKMTANLAIDTTKKEKRRSTDDLYDGTFDAKLPKPLESELEEKDLLSYLMKVLSPVQAEIFKMRYHEFPHAYIGKSLNLTVDNCRQHFAQARSKLRSQVSRDLLLS